MLAGRENFGHVVECGCGTIHVTVGPVSLALDEKALRNLHEMLAQAIANLDTIGADLPELPPLFEHTTPLAMRTVLKLKQ